MENPKDLRNMASSVGMYSFTGKQAEWNEWTIRKAVKEGYKASGWVYRAVSLITQNASSVPWVVVNKKGEIQPEHPIQILLANPHPHLTRQQLMALLVSWLQLGGNGYMKMLNDGQGMTKELWPISPDRIAPVSSKDTSQFVDSYEIITDDGSMKATTEFTIENVIHLQLMDPSNPLVGIGPLQAAARAVDLDNSQQDWNVSTMQNRGVVDGVFSFKRDLDKTQSDSILARIKEKFSRNKREPLVIGSDASYTRLGLTSVEMDFLESRKLNREEIFIIFGVPPQLAGAMDSSTYNNFSTSLRIFWETTIMSLLDTMSDQFNHAFADQLKDGYRVMPDVSDVKALRGSESDKSATSKTYFDMGVPVSVLNERFDLGLSEYTGWDLPFAGKTPGQTSPAETTRKEYTLIPFEKRDVEAEQKLRDEIAEGDVNNMFLSLLSTQEARVIAAIDSGSDPIDTLKADYSIWLKSMQDISLSIAEEFAATVIVDERGERPKLDRRATADDLLEQYLIQEAVMLHDLSLITATTTAAIIDQVRYAADNNSTVDQLKQAIQDTGVFSPERSLRLARTLTGTASSIGQLSGAAAAGAERKIWATAAFEVREAHINRGGESVGINDRFSLQVSTVGPRYPLDPEIAAEDRINCRCSMRFE